MSSEQVRARLRPFGISFEKSLTDLIKGIRSNNHDPEKLAAFLEDSIQECRNELKTNDLELKSMAILKLSYLEMYGFDMSWCSFHVLEVMSSSKFQHKRIGYLAAIQILQRQNNDDALMLMTNLLKKDINSSNFVETGMAISGIAAIVTNDLAQDICDDMVKMLNHSKPFIRKKAVLAMYKIFLKYPEALRTNFSKLIDKLEDDDNSVVSAAVNVICELAHNNPKNYVDLAPRLFGLLKDTNNNWMVIRLLKLLSSLCLTEPRLKYILLPEVVELMNSTKALSLVYESINCILNGQMLTSEDTKVAKMIINQLIGFLQNEDQDLKYVGLLAFIKTCKIQKDLIKKHDKVIMASIYNNDLTIREKALEIIDSLVTEKNIVMIVSRLLIQLIPIEEQAQKLGNLNERDYNANGELNEFADQQHNDFFITRKQEPIVVTKKFKGQVINKIIQICSMENYKNIPNFRWYLGVLTDIIKLNSDNKIEHVDRLVSEQFVSLGVRVPSIRSRLVSVCIDLTVLNDEKEIQSFRDGLKNCIWIIGEYYCDYITSLDSDDEDDDDDDSENGDDDRSHEDSKVTAAQIIDKVVRQNMLKAMSSDLSNNTLAIYIHSMAKLLSNYCNSLGTEWGADTYQIVIDVVKVLVEWLESFQSSFNFEVQERSFAFAEFLKLILESLTVESETETVQNGGSNHPPYLLTSGYSQLFSEYQIKPVANSLLYKIPVSEKLHFETAINEESIVEFNRLLVDVSAKDNDEVSDGSDDDDVVSLQGELDNYYDSGDEVLDSKVTPSEAQKRKKERLERMKHDPYYIPLEGENTDNSTIGASSNTGTGKKTVERTRKKPVKTKKIKKEKVLILGVDEADSSETLESVIASKPKTKKDKNKLIIDSSTLVNFDLQAQEESQTETTEHDIEVEVERLRKKFEQTSSQEPIKSTKPKKKKASASAADPSEARPVIETTKPAAEVLVAKKPRKPKKKQAIIQD